jgi:hypothetical protein
MEIINGIIEYIKTHWADIITIYLSIVGAASVIVKLTPTPKDDAILKTIMDFVAKFIALNKPVGK